MKKLYNQQFALKLLLMTALDIHQDIVLVDVEPLGKDRVTTKKLLEIIKCLSN